MKILEFHLRKNKNHENLRIPFENYENYKIHRIPSERINKILKIQKHNARIMKINNIIEFHMIIMKTIKILKES